MSNEHNRSEELFDTLNKNKKRKKRKLIRTVLILIVLAAVVLLAVVLHLRSRVNERFAHDRADVKTYAVTTGTIRTLVSGSGTLNQVDLEELTVPSGVEITEVLVERDDAITVGDLLATVDMSSVMTALSDLQEELDDLDDEIADAKGDEVSGNINAGIAGRVKQIYAAPGTDVSACMAEHGALAVLSLDGKMAVEIENETLAKGDSVTVRRADGTNITGTVDSAFNGKVVILVTDKGPKVEEAVTVLNQEGAELGSGKLYIHSPLAVTGYAGTVKSVSVKENQHVKSGNNLFKLKNTSFSANYDTLLRQRGELEEELLELLTIYRDGAVLAPMDGIISSVDYSEETTSTPLYSTVPTDDGPTNLVTVYPNISMNITIGIDETDILSLKVGQEAQITVSSVSEDPFTGSVTEISKEANTASGVTIYSAVITLDKAEGMLAGMTADVDVAIEGVENAMIIPVDALHQTSAKRYVYTSYDPETQQYGDMVEVVTGMQNDDYVEILSGLTIGDTVYYTEQQKFFFGFGNFGGGAQAGRTQSGGSMPPSAAKGGKP